MSVTKVASKKYPVKPVMTDGVPLVMSDAALEREKMLDALAMLKDAMNMYPIRMNGKTPAPQLFSRYGVMLVPFPLGGHDVQITVMADGKFDFMVDMTPIIPVMSKDKR